MLFSLIVPTCPCIMYVLSAIYTFSYLRSRALSFIIIHFHSLSFIIIHFHSLSFIIIHYHSLSLIQSTACTGYNFFYTTCINLSDNHTFDPTFMYSIFSNFILTWKQCSNHLYTMCLYFCIYMHLLQRLLHANWFVH